MHDWQLSVKVQHAAYAMFLLVHVVVLLLVHVVLVWFVERRTAQHSTCLTIWE